MEIQELDKEPHPHNKKMYIRKSQSRLLGIELKVAIQNYAHLHPELKGNVIDTSEWHFEINGKTVESDDVVEIKLEESVTDYNTCKTTLPSGLTITRIIE